MKVTSTQYNLTQAVNNTANTKSANAESATPLRAQATTPVDPVLGEAQGNLRPCRKWIWIALTR